MRVLLLATIVSLALAGCTTDAPDGDALPPNENADDSDAMGPVQKEVTITGFVLPDVTVHVGDTIVWTNNAAPAHTATSDDGTTFDSGRMDQGESWSWTATEAGTFPYHCTFHSNMQGTVKVLA